MEFNDRKESYLHERMHVQTGASLIKFGIDKMKMLKKYRIPIVSILYFYTCVNYNTF